MPATPRRDIRGFAAKFERQATLICLFFIAAARAEVLPVPSQYATIQAAIHAALDGDVVELADGTHAGVGNKNLDFGGRAITVRSASRDPCKCIIDCEGSGRGFYFHSYEGSDSIVDGVSVMGGWVEDSMPGGAKGGGVCCDFSSSPTLIHCTITGNTAASKGGGISCSGDSCPTLSHCVITGNWADGDGGGVHSLSSSPTLTNCTILGNTADRGGGIYCCGDRPALTNCIITGNAATYNGGGVQCYLSNPTLVTCMIAHNTAGYDGGGVYSYVSNPTLTNCTITGNMAGDDGGGVYCSSYRPQLTNCILWADAPQEIYLHSGGVVVTYSDVEGSWSGTGNINADPLFRDPDGPDNDPATTADNDHRLSSNSPCIDADDPSVAPAPGATDLDGNRRLWDGDGDGMTISDMGAYEYGSYRFGDLNCDGYVDFDDINPLTLALLTPDVYATAYPDCSLQIADINGNGVVDYADVNPFVALLAAQ